MSGAKPFDFFEFFRGFAPKHPTCDHLLSSQMPDGKYFCPSCKTVSDWPLKAAK